MKEEHVGGLFAVVGLVCLVVTAAGDEANLGVYSALASVPALILGAVAWKRKLGKAVVLMSGGVLLVGMFGAWLVGHVPSRERRVLVPPAFTGPSTDLEWTVIVPTLDTAIPQGSNAIWCASFQLAWDRMKTDVVKEPIVLAGAGKIAKALNAAEVDEQDLPPDSYYAIAGWVSDGVYEKAKKEMAERFGVAGIPPPTET